MGEVTQFLRKMFHFLVFVYILYLIYNYNLNFTKYSNNWYYLCTLLIFYYLIYDFINKAFIINVFTIIVDIFESFLIFSNSYLLDSINYFYLIIYLFKFIRMFLRLVNSICRHFR